MLKDKTAGSICVAQYFTIVYVGIKLDPEKVAKTKSFFFSEVKYNFIQPGN